MDVANQELVGTIPFGDPMAKGFTERGGVAWGEGGAQPAWRRAAALPRSSVADSREPQRAMTALKAESPRPAVRRT